MITFESIDKSYLINLIKKQESGLYLLEDHLNNIVFGKTCIYGKTRIGVAYVTKFDGKYYFEAYKDNDIRIPISILVECGRKFLKLFENTYAAQCKIKELYSIHRKSNRLATMALRKLNFKAVKNIDYCILFVRNIWD